MRLLGSFLAATLVLACTALPAGAPGPRRAAPPMADGAGRPAHVVLISVAGLTPDRYLEGDEMPVLAALAREGVAAERVDPVAPAAVYPAHATLVTGVTPAEHGIVADQLIGERGVRATPPAHASRAARRRRCGSAWPRPAAPSRRSTGRPRPGPRSRRSCPT